MFPTEFYYGNSRRIEYRDLGEGTKNIYRHRFDGTTFLTVVEYKEIKDWCKNQFGTHLEAWMAVDGVFWFRDQNHAFEFRMRWC